MHQQFIYQNAVHVGAMLYLVCFLFRDQIWLRSFAIAGDVAYVTYYYNISEQPLWSAILWNIPNAVINIAMICAICPVPFGALLHASMSMTLHKSSPSRTISFRTSGLVNRH